MTHINQITFKLYTLLTTQAISLIGSRMTAFALGLWLYQRTGRTMDLLLIPFFNELPNLLLGHLLGVAVDRYSRKWLIVLADLGQALGSLLLVYSIASGHFALWHLYLVVTLQGAFATLQTPAVDSVLTGFTHEANRSRVNAVKELTFPLAGGLAPALGGLLFISFGIEGVLMADLVSFLIGSGVILKIGISEQRRSLEQETATISWSTEAKAGFAFLQSKSSLIGLMVYVAFVNFLLNGPLELLLPYLLEVTKNPLMTTGLMTIMSLSTALSALYFSVMRLPKRPLLMLCVLLSLTGIALMLIGLARSPWMLLALIALAMAPLPVINIVFKTLLQNHVPEAFQGRVFAIAYQFAYGIAPLSFLMVGPLVDQGLEPFMQDTSVPWLVRLFGNTAGSGMGLTLSLTGLLMVVVSLMFARSKSRQLLD